MSVQLAFLLACLALALVVWDLGRRRWQLSAESAEIERREAELGERIAALERETDERFNKTAVALDNLDKKHSSRNAAPAVRAFGLRK